MFESLVEVVKYNLMQIDTSRIILYEYVLNYWLLLFLFVYMSVTPYVFALLIVLNVDVLHIN